MDVAETAALAHDLGHPPFGHAAEDELAACFKLLGIAEGFEGNAQSFRIVTKLAVRQGDHPGLNLTRASLAAILKYPWKHGANGDESFKKWGCFATEIEDFEFARGLAITGDTRKSLEAEIMDWSDDVTYSIHDLDDCYRSGLIPLDRLLRDIDHRGQFIEWCMNRWTTAGDRAPLTADAANELFELIGWIGAFGNRSPLTEPFTGLATQRRTLDRVSSIFLRRYLYGDDESTPPLTLVDNATDRRLNIDPDIRGEVALLKLMRYYVYENPALAGQQYGQRSIVRMLFGVFYEAAELHSNTRGLIPHGFRQAAQELDGSNSARARLAADIIVSLTEQEALLLHARLTGSDPGSVLDHIFK